MSEQTVNESKMKWHCGIIHSWDFISLNRVAIVNFRVVSSFETASLSDHDASYYMNNRQCHLKTNNRLCETH